MERITKQPIKRFARISLIYSSICALIFTALLIFALALPNTASMTSVMLLIAGDVICIILCIMLFYHYCLSAAYEISHDSGEIDFRTLCKSYRIKPDEIAKIISAGNRRIVKISPSDLHSAKTLYLYKELGFGGALFDDNDIKALMQWKNPEAE